MLDKILYEEEVRQLVNTYEQQFHYGVFYAYMRLRWGRGGGGGCRHGCGCGVGAGVGLSVWQHSAVQHPGAAGGADAAAKVALSCGAAGGAHAWLPSGLPLPPLLLNLAPSCPPCLPALPACPGLPGCREQEVRNIMWIAECVAQDQKGRVQDGIVFTF